MDGRCAKTPRCECINYWPTAMWNSLLLPYLRRPQLTRQTRFKGEQEPAPVNRIKWVRTGAIVRRTARTCEWVCVPLGADTTSSGYISTHLWKWSAACSRAAPHPTLRLFPANRSRSSHAQGGASIGDSEEAGTTAGPCPTLDGRVMDLLASTCWIQFGRCGQSTADQRRLGKSW